MCDVFVLFLPFSYISPLATSSDENPFVIQSCLLHKLRIVVLLSLLRQHVRNDINIIIINNNRNDTIVIVIQSSTIAQ